MSFLIEKNIPVTRTTRTIELPLKDMEIGDSFVYADGQSAGDLKGKRNSVNTILRKVNRAEDFTTSILSEQGKFVVRVWRLK